MEEKRTSICYYHQAEDGENCLVNESLSWGGLWTEEKLEAFEKYVNAYLTIMNASRAKNRWKLIYFDGFAGSGSRNNPKEEPSSFLQSLFHETFLQEEDLCVYKGAAERVLSIPQKGFDFYYFIDKDKESSLKLHELLSPFENDHIIVYRNSDANKQIEMLADALHNDNKLVSLVLLDPFGMQVNWHSIELLKKTRTDLWILIPTGVIVNRLLDRKGELSHIDKLTTFFGKDENYLRSYFYSKRQEHTLFGEKEIVEKVKRPIQKITELYIQQLKGVFQYVTPEPLVLNNSRNTPIFHFACASNNKTAIKIANEIIAKKQKP